MFGKFKNWHSGLSKVGRATLWLVASGLVVGMAAASPDTTLPETKPPAQVQTQKPTITKKIITETAAIPFTSSTVDDGTLAQGKTAVKIAGVNGVKTLTYDVTYQDGKQTNKQLVKEEITTPPVNEVIANGTYVAPSCPNGTYVNSAGNTVCSPYASNSAPVGATAQCVDGTYSFSQSRSGTCSHHGGVAQWL